MRKTQIVVLAFAAVFAFSMIAASGASAEFTLWDQCTKIAPALEFVSPDCLGTPGTSWGWEEITTLLPVDSLPVDLELIDLGLVTIRILCEDTLDGSVGANGEDEITELLTLGGAQITLAGPVACTNVENCATPMFAPENLPWSTQLVEATSEDAAGDLLGPKGTGGSPAWWLKCGSTENECGKADTILLVATNTDELEVVLTLPGEADTTYLPLMTCTNAFEKESLFKGTVGILLVNGNALRAM